MKWIIEFPRAFDDGRSTYFKWMEMVDMGTTPNRKHAYVFESRAQARQTADMLDNGCTPKPKVVKQ